MDNKQHSPLPWESIKNDDGLTSNIQDADDNLFLFHLWREEAELIVKCVNENASLHAKIAEQQSQIEVLREALKEAGDVIQSYHMTTGIDLGDASRMPFYSDTLAKIDNALATLSQTGEQS